MKSYEDALEKLAEKLALETDYPFSDKYMSDCAQMYKTGFLAAVELLLPVIESASKQTWSKHANRHDDSSLGRVMDDFDKLLEEK